MTIADVIFTAVSAITLLGAVLAVWPRSVFHNAMALILTLFGVACLFIYLNAEFLAVVQIIIYIGAISIAIIFAIMLSRPWFQKSAPRDARKLFRAFLIAFLLFGGLSQLTLKTQWPSVVAGDDSLRAIGRSLLTTYALPFEVVSVVLLVAIIGALTISATREKQ